jgi:NTE family protein
MAKHPRLGLVIGYGGLKCAVAIGVLQVLEQENTPLDMVVGCSGGAIFGASIAMGFSAAKMIDILGHTWSPDTTQKLDFGSLAKIGLPGAMGFDDEIGILDDQRLVDGLVQAYGADTTFADIRIPFYCVTTDFRTGESFVISSGNIVRAIRASAGIPVLFKPVECNGRWLVDGVLSNPLPVDVAIQEGADVIIAVGFETPLMKSISSPANFASQMFNILVNQLLYRKFAFYNLAYHSEIIAIVPHFEKEIHLNEVDSIPFIIEQGRNETLKHLEHIKQALTLHV